MHGLAVRHEPWDLGSMQVRIIRFPLDMFYSKYRLLYAKYSIRLPRI